ncbi:Hypothetical predicted protein [Mytilus galloprovincialis]|uniref:Uncharacterized protein n=1 Tax=Mytilus galloprovincialis TaxID=29158 RepID=A0A8B6FW90_MYTGA|nr:Hypothetical predicted protein [Mytilus galloprovincialis]
MTHAKCTGIKRLASVVHNIKIEKSKETVEREINSILSLLDQFVSNKSTNIRAAERQYISIKESIGDIRKEINEYLDHLEKKLCQDADIIWNQEKSKATGFIFEIEEQKKNLERMKEHLQTVTTHTSKLQSFLGVHYVEQQVHQCQRFVDDLDNDERIKEVDIRIKQNDEIEKIITKLLSIESFGEVTVVKTKTDFNRGTSGRTEAQVKSQDQSNINNMTMNIETQIEIDIKRFIRDMICLMDGRIIVVERNGTVYLLTPDGKHRKELQELFGANSVTQINDNTIAVVHVNPYNTTIRMFNMENEEFTKDISLNKKGICLSFSNSCLAVGVNWDEICIIDLEGNIMKTIKVFH